MTRIRALLVGLMAMGLVGLPGAVSAGTPSSGFDRAVIRHQTSIRWMAFGHIHAAGSAMTIVGQVASFAQGHRGALAGVQVKLYRRLDGNSTWVYQSAQRTGTGTLPQFHFRTVTRQNAHYKVVFGGNASFGPTSEVTWGTVYRLFNGKITDHSGAATYAGNVTPFYTNKPISLQKRSCATCSYVTVKRATTGTNGAYRFSLPAPSNGRWWWRVAVPGTVAFIPSYGGTITTELV